MSVWPSFFAKGPREGGGDALADMRREVDRVFEDLGLPGAAPFGAQPRADVRHGGVGVEIHVELPGLEPSEVEVWLEGNSVVIGGERKREAEIEEGEWKVRERSHGAFVRRVRLPFEPLPGDVEAEMRHGLLAIMIKKPPEPTAAAHKIAIRGGARPEPKPDPRTEGGEKPAPPAPEAPAAPAGGMLGEGAAPLAREPERVGGMIGEG